jgi:hypothetical protein
MKISLLLKSEGKPPGSSPQNLLAISICLQILMMIAAMVKSMPGKILTHFVCFSTISKTTFFIILLFPYLVAKSKEHYTSLNYFSRWAIFRGSIMTEAVSMKPKQYHVTSLKYRLCASCR